MFSNLDAIAKAYIQSVISEATPPMCSGAKWREFNIDHYAPDLASKFDVYVNSKSVFDKIAPNAKNIAFLDSVNEIMKASYDAKGLLGDENPKSIDQPCFAPIEMFTNVLVTCLRAATGGDTSNVPKDLSIYKSEMSGADVFMDKVALLNDEHRLISSTSFDESSHRFKSVPVGDRRPYGMRRQWKGYGSYAADARMKTELAKKASESLFGKGTSTKDITPADIFGDDPKSTYRDITPADIFGECVDSRTNDYFNMIVNASSIVSEDIDKIEIPEGYVDCGYVRDFYFRIGRLIVFGVLQHDIDNTNRVFWQDSFVFDNSSTNDFAKKREMKSEAFQIVIEDKMNTIEMIRSILEMHKLI
jgi:hypothetical protein